MIDRPISKSTMPSDATRVYKGEIFDVWQWHQEMYDGSSALFERVSRKDTVEVIATTVAGEILLAHEEQPSVAPYIAIPAGVIDEGEDPVDAAKRELREELGVVSGALELWYAEQPYTKMDWAVYTFVARGCEKKAEPTLDAGEKISPFSVSFDGFMETVTDPTFRAKGVALRVLAAARKPEDLLALKALFFGA